MSRASLALALGTGLLAAVALGATAAEIDQQAFSKMSVPVRELVLADQSILSFDVDATVESDGTLHRLVMLPADAGEARLELLRGQGDLGPAEIIGQLRGRPVLSLRVDNAAAGELEISIHHDGSWDRQASAYSRDFDRVFRTLISGTDSDRPREAGDSGNGSYVIITAPEYVAAAQPLVDWKRQKGFEVVLVTTDTTGQENTAIQAWLRSAYANWDVPPEYVLLLGDVDVLPAWSFSENVSDHPYTLMDLDDWLPDLHLGRMSVEGSQQAETLVNKTVAYERDPYVAEGRDWFTRSLMVAGNYGSTSPSTTVTWCGEQLETIGFEPAGTVFFPPMFNGVYPITNFLEEGVSICAYRGWAYGTAGWEPPHFTVDNIPGVDNGAMMPVVMSFVCLNGNFEGNDPCFGEVFIRQGSPTESKGAVAFIGNGEHWSHTRYNDAMAIAYFEHIVDDDITTLGQVTMAGKLTFMNYFPHELNETGDEQSVEFYFHIYNLLGDPELNFWKQAPADLRVDGPANVHVGTNFLALSVRDDTSETLLEGARLGVVQHDVLLGCAFSDANGDFFLALNAPLEDGNVQVTVTAPGYIPDTSTFSVGEVDNLLSVVESNPATLLSGEVVDLDLLLRNVGSEESDSENATLVAESSGVTITQETAETPELDPGESAWTNDSFTLELAFGLEDGLLLPFRLDVPDMADPAYFSLAVSAPKLVAASVIVDGDGFADPGETVNLVVNLTNEGSADIQNGTATLSLNGPGGVVIDKTTASFDAMAAGSGAGNDGDPFILTINDDSAVGMGLNFILELASTDGHVLSTSLSLKVGQVDIGSPVGPDNYGYYALDSADINYPGQMPIYDWFTLSPKYGGAGDALDFPTDEYADQGPTTLLVDLPFDFQYYGQVFDQIRVSDNGWISFDTRDFYDFYNWGMPNAHGNHSQVAAFWDNFRVIPDEGLPDGAHRDGIFTSYVVSEGAFIVEWSQMRHYLPQIDDLQTFQLWILDPAVHGAGPMGDGEMLFLYKQVANSDYARNYATVGIESPGEDDGLQYSYANLYADGAAALSPGLAIRITTDRPVYDPLTLALGEARRSGAGFSLKWEPADSRPVIGWRILRDGEIIATLPSGARAYEDPLAESETEYQLVALHPFGQETRFGVLGEASQHFFSLMPATPNPSRDGARIDFSLGQAGPVSLSIYDVSGRLVRTLLSGESVEGAQSRHWDGRDEGGHELASGVYFYRLQAGERSLTRKLVLIR